MVKILIALAACLLIAVVVMAWRMHRMKTDIYSFTGQLEQYLAAMAAGEEFESPDEMEDTLPGKVQERLQRLDGIWKQKDAENLEEKRNIKALVSDISHQTKTPIANIKMYLELLQDEEVLSIRGREFLQKLQAQTQKLDFLLQSMVKLSRLETGIIEIHQKNSSLYETLGHAVEAIVPKAEAKQIRLYVDCAETIQVVHDQKWTEEAMFNLLDNAVKYTGEGGSIRILAAVQEIFTKISILDSGKGIPLERQAEIFTRFYREPEVYGQEGVGIGLYLARKIITLQGGYIEVRSQPGQGSEFRVFLPNESSHSCEIPIL